MFGTSIKFLIMNLNGGLLHQLWGIVVFSLGCWTQSKFSLYSLMDPHNWEHKVSVALTM